METRTIYKCTLNEEGNISITEKINICPGNKYPRILFSDGTSIVVNKLNTVVNGNIVYLYDKDLNHAKDIFKKYFNIHIKAYETKLQKYKYMSDKLKED